MSMVRVQKGYYEAKNQHCIFRLSIFHQKVRPIDSYTILCRQFFYNKLSL